MQKTKGIILAGGKATRLFPITKVISKQLLPIYDKPMIYYPLSILMLAEIRDILIISTSEALPLFKELFKDGSDLGLRISYKQQDKPRGLPDAFIVGQDFIGEDRVCLVLGDNIFYGDGLQSMLNKAVNESDATVFGYYVRDPQRYGVVTFDKSGKVTSIVEKPQNPTSNWAVTGLYFFDHRVVEITKALKPSQRGELEITDVIRAYLQMGKLKVVDLGRGYAWLDTGTYDSLIDASNFVRTLEERQGLKIGCIEEIAYRKGFINKDQLKRLADEIKTNYGMFKLRTSVYSSCPARRFNQTHHGRNL